MPRPTDAAWLREQRAALGMTQAQLAAALGLSPQHIAKLEGGVSPVQQVHRLAVERLLSSPAPA